MIAAGPKAQVWIVGAALVLAASFIGGCAAAKPEPRTCIEPTYSYLRQPMASADATGTSERDGSDHPDSGEWFNK
jgi:hypothetical protein